MKLLTQILLASLVTLKIVFGSILLYRGGIGPTLVQHHALASEPASIAQTPPDETLQTRKEEQIELSYLLKRKRDLEQQEMRLEKKKADLIAIQGEIEKKIAILTRLREEIRAEMAQKKNLEDQKFKLLIKAYSAMNPQKAADLIGKLDIKFSTELLSKMKGDDVGKILSFMEADRAARITQELASRN